MSNFNVGQKPANTIMLIVTAGLIAQMLLMASLIDYHLMVEARKMPNVAPAAAAAITSTTKATATAETNISPTGHKTEPEINWSRGAPQLNVHQRSHEGCRSRQEIVREKLVEMLDGDILIGMAQELQNERLSTKCRVYWQTFTSVIKGDLSGGAHYFEDSTEQVKRKLDEDGDDNDDDDDDGSGGGGDDNDGDGDSDSYNYNYNYDDGFMRGPKWGQIFVHVLNIPELVKDLLVVRQLQDCTDYWRAGAETPSSQSLLDQQQSLKKLAKVKSLLDNLIKINDENEAKIRQFEFYLLAKDQQIDKRKMMHEIEIEQLKNEHQLEINKLQTRLDEMEERKNNAKVKANENDNQEINEVKTLKEELKSVLGQLKDHCTRFDCDSSVKQSQEKLAQEKAALEIRLAQQQMFNQSLAKNGKKLREQVNKLLKEHGKSLNEINGAQREVIESNDDCQARLGKLSQEYERSENRRMECEKNAASLELKIEDVLAANQMSGIHHHQSKVNGAHLAAAAISGGQQQTSYSRRQYELAVDNLIMLVNKYEKLMINEDRYYDQWIQSVVNFLQAIKKLRMNPGFNLASKYNDYSNALEDNLDAIEEMMIRMEKIARFEEKILNNFTVYTHPDLLDWWKKVNRLNDLIKGNQQTPARVRDFVNARMKKGIGLRL